MRDLIPEPWDTLSRRQMFNQLSHPGVAGWGALNLVEAAALPLTPSGQSRNSPERPPLW